MDLFKKKEKNYTDESEIINEYIPQDEIKNLIQEDLPFIKAENKTDTKSNLMPSLDLLVVPSKRKEGSEQNENNDPKFLEKFY